jgi:hypothetical protein
MITPVLTTEIATTKVQVELSSHVLSQLLKSGLLHGADCKSLNASAKKVIWQAILATITDNKESHLCA